MVDRSMGCNSSTGSCSSLPSIPGTPNTSSHDVATKSIQLPSAYDRVFIAVSGSDADADIAAIHHLGSYSVACTLEPSTEINFMDACHVAILIRTISELRPQYDAIKNQCYWFADSIFQTIMTVTECKEKHGVDSDMRGKLYMLPLKKSSQKSRQASAEVNDGGTTGECSNYWWKAFTYSPQKETDSAGVLEAYNIAVEREEVSTIIRNQ